MKAATLIRFSSISQVILLIICASLGFSCAAFLESMLCSDYEMLIINTKQCVSRCPIRCLNGVCFEDGVCPCDNFYETSFEKGLICSLDCLPGCISAGGFCATADLCLCRKGYIFDAVARRCFKHTFLHRFDRCGGRCLYGKCNSNGECICAEGYQRNNSTIFGQLCSPVCKQDCGRQGYCYLPNMCACRHKHHHYEADGRCHKDSDHY